MLKLSPACKAYLWGGRRLREEYHVRSEQDVVAEAWELSCNDAGCSIISQGEDAGMTLKEYIEENGRKILGKNCRRFRQFPILTKLIDAKDNLSIQVHPGDAYAKEKENSYGKTEMWYVLDAAPGAYLYYGFSKSISREEFEKRILENTLPEVLNKVPVKKGDVFFIKAGTIHAICAGIVIAEIQQNSDLTYRVYDYGRVGADGRTRQLHIKEALEVTDTKAVKPPASFAPHLGTCEYFTVDKAVVQEDADWHGTVDDTSFLHILIVDGSGSVSAEGESTWLKRGDSVLLTAGSRDVTISGACQALLTTIPGEYQYETA